MATSVIIPTLNEAGGIVEAIRSLRAQGDCQIIVADGGSTDATPALAVEAHMVVMSPPGRAVQMNAGAARATGDILVFLHADCRLEAGAVDEAERWLQNPAIIAGCYHMRVDARGLLYRSIDTCATARVRLTGIMYGDQGLFVRRRDFERLGGFPALALMEDVYFSKLLRRHGRIAVADRKIFVSPRRWQRSGLARQTLRNWTLTMLAGVGVHPNLLARFYPIVR